jgi:butyryl-CoA dehydrogenase
MFDYLLNDEQKSFLEEVRDFVKWVPRQVILDMDEDKIKFPKEVYRRRAAGTFWDAGIPKSGAAGAWIGLPRA